MKRLIALIIFIAMIASLISVISFAAVGDVFYSGVNDTKAGTEYEDRTKALKYTIISGLNVSVSKNTRTSADIPSGDMKINSIIYNSTRHYIVDIPSEAFKDCLGLTSVTIGSSVTKIGTRAFSGCSGLTSVSTGNNVTEIGSYAFSGCSGLTSVIIPSNVTTISDYAFNNCSGLTSVTIPNTVTSIGASAFQNCSSLTDLTIGSGVKSIGINAFKNCSALTSVTIPNSVTMISNYAFSGCLGLTSVTIPNSVTSIGQQAFYKCSKLTSITIPNSVTSIGVNAFGLCSELTSATIGSGITTIGGSAFGSCSALESVTVNAATPPALGNANAFSGCNSELKIYVPAESVGAYKSATNWSTYESKIFAIPSDVEDEIVDEGAEENDPEVELDLGFGPVTVKTSGQSVVFNDKKYFEASIGDGDIFVPIDLSSVPKKIDGLFFNNEVYRYIDNAGKDIKIINRFAYAEVYTNKEIGLNPLSLHLSDVSEIAGTCATAIQKNAMETSKVYAQVNYSFVSNGKPVENDAKIYVPVDGPAKVFYLFNENKIGIVPCEVKDGYCEFNRYFDGTYVICSAD